MKQHNFPKFRDESRVLGFHAKKVRHPQNFKEEETLRLNTLFIARAEATIKLDPLLA